METIVQFLSPGDEFMAHGQRHTIREVTRLGDSRQVVVTGARTDGQLFEAVFDWDDLVDTLAVTL